MRAARVIFLAAGADKASVLHEVLEGPPALERLPSQGIRPDAGDLVWLVDRAAAAQLDQQGYENLVDRIRHTFVTAGRVPNGDDRLVELAD